MSYKLFNKVLVRPFYGPKRFFIHKIEWLSYEKKWLYLTKPYKLSIEYRELNNSSLYMILPISIFGFLFKFSNNPLYKFHFKDYEEGLQVYNELVMKRDLMNKMLDNENDKINY